MGAADALQFGKTKVSKLRIYLPEGEPHMLLIDESGIVVAEVWDYRLRASIESGETDPASVPLTEALASSAVSRFASDKFNYCPRCDSGRTFHPSDTNMGLRHCWDCDLWFDLKNFLQLQ